jgi:hypothetical protein
MSKLPSVVSSIPQDLKAFINQVREALDGRNGEKLVTVNDLIRGGLAAPGPSNTIVPPAGVVGTPATPKNVQASGAIQNIVVTWDDPLYNGHAYAEVWGSSTDDLGAAVQVGMTPGAIFVDAVGPSVIRYYWVRFVNVLGVQGAFNAVAGVQGETGADVEYLLETLTGAITETQLFDELGSRIDLVDQTNGGLINKYVVKIDTNGYVSGFGLASTTNNATPLSDFIIRADRFSVASPSGPGITPVIPFIVTTTEQIINGVTVPVGVYINGAFIQNGTITNAKIGNAAIDDAKIVSLTAAKLTAGDISVGNYIQSTGFITGSQGWRIHGNGFAEFGAAAIRGQLTASQINSNGLSIRDTSGNIILNAGTGNFTGSLDGTAASTVVSTANSALSTANTANSTANTANSTANTANSTANTANSTANTANSTANTANSTANSALAGLTTKLNSDARNVLSGSGGIALGSLNWDTNGNRTSGSGVGITRAGLAAFNTAGTTTFVLDAANGSAAFAGELRAASGTFAGSLSAASGTFTGTLTASAVNAVNTINIAGNAVTVPSTLSGVLFTAVSKNGYAVWQTLMTINVDFGSAAVNTTVVLASINLLFDSGSGQTASYIRVRETTTGSATVDNGVTHSNSVQLTVINALTSAFTGTRTFVIEVSQLTSGANYTVGNANITVLGAKR